jgi:hypothetical protein
VTRLQGGPSSIQIQSGRKIISSRKCPDHVWIQPSLVFSGYSVHFQRLSRWSVKLATRLSSASLRNELSYTPTFAVCAYGVDSNNLAFVLTLPYQLRDVIFG